MLKFKNSTTDNQNSLCFTQRASAHYTLHKISRSKNNHTMKLGQLIVYIKINIFLQN